MMNYCTSYSIGSRLLLIMLTIFLEGAYEIMQHIYSGLIYKAKLKPCTDMESSFVGIYASNSPGNCISYYYLFDLTPCFIVGDLCLLDSFWAEMGSFR